MRTYAARAGALVAALGAAGAVAFGQARFSPMPSPAAPQVVELPPAAVQLFCPVLAPPSSAGELRADGTNAVDAWQPTLRAGSVPPSQAALTYVPLDWQAVGETTPAPGAPQGATLGQTPAPLPSTPGAGQDLLIPTAYGGQVRALTTDAPGLDAVAAVQLASTQGAYAGLAAAPCVGGATDQWLVGGASSHNAGAMVRLINQSSRVATVEIEGYGTTGVLQAAARTVRIAPRQGSDIPLEALAAGEARPVLHLRSDAAISAIMLAHETQGLTPGGIGVVSATSASAEQVVLFPPGAQSLRLFNPTQSTATLSVDTLSSTGRSTLPGSQQVELRAGVVSEIPLGLHEAGALVVKSDVAVLAAVRSYGPLMLTATRAQTPPAQERATTSGREVPSASASTRADATANTVTPSPSASKEAGAPHDAAATFAATVPFHQAPTAQAEAQLPGAAAKLTQLPAADGPRDLAWSGALPALESASLMVPSSGVLLLANPGKDPVTVRVTAAGQTRQVEVRAGTVNAVEVDGVTQVDSSGPVRASAFLNLPGQRGGIEVIPVVAPAQSVKEMQLVVEK